MSGIETARRAYQSSARHRGLRDQEADVFLRVNAVLRGIEARPASGADTVLRCNALSDNRRLWLTLLDLMRDPANSLPPALKASIVSVGMAVQRENDSETPDLRFLIGINEQMAAGLSGH